MDKQTFLSKTHRLVDEAYLLKHFKIYPIHHRENEAPLEYSISKPDDRFIENGLVLPRVFILEYFGICSQLINIFSEEQFTQQPISVHGIHGVSQDDSSHAISYTTNPSEDIRHLIEKLKEQDDTKFRFVLLVQTFGQIAIPTYNRQSVFIRPDKSLFEAIQASNTYANVFIKSKL
jgi:hypothetical protein